MAIFRYGSKEPNNSQWLRPNMVCRAFPRTAPHGLPGLLKISLNLRCDLLTFDLLVILKVTSHLE
jgi:hypothetical protein